MLSCKKIVCENSRFCFVLSAICMYNKQRLWNWYTAMFLKLCSPFIDGSLTSTVAYTKYIYITVTFYGNVDDVHFDTWVYSYRCCIIKFLMSTMVIILSERSRAIQKEKRTVLLYMCFITGGPINCLVCFRYHMVNTSTMNFQFCL